MSSRLAVTTEFRTPGRRKCHVGQAVCEAHGITGACCVFLHFNREKTWATQEECVGDDRFENNSVLHVVRIGSIVSNG